MVPSLKSLVFPHFLVSLFSGWRAARVHLLRLHNKSFHQEPRGRLLLWKDWSLSKRRGPGRGWISLPGGWRGERRREPPGGERGASWRPSLPGGRRRRRRQGGRAGWSSWSGQRETAWRRTGRWIWRSLNWRRGGTRGGTRGGRKGGRGGGRKEGRDGGWREGRAVRGRGLDGEGLEG